MFLLALRPAVAGEGKSEIELIKINKLPFPLPHKSPAQSFQQTYRIQGQMKVAKQGDPKCKLCLWRCQHTRFTRQAQSFPNNLARTELAQGLQNIKSNSKGPIHKQAVTDCPSLILLPLSSQDPLVIQNSLWMRLLVFEQTHFSYSGCAICTVLDTVEHGIPCQMWAKVLNFPWILIQ